MRDALRLLGFLAAFGSAIIHLGLAPEHAAEDPAYIGWLFYASALLLFPVAAGIGFYDLRLVWHLGALVCAGMVIGLVASRTTGLPGGYREGWDEPEAVVSLVLELVFLVCWLVRLRVPAESGSEREVTRDAQARS